MCMIEESKFQGGFLDPNIYNEEYLVALLLCPLNH